MSTTPAGTEKGGGRRPRPVPAGDEAQVARWAARYRAFRDRQKNGRTGSFTPWLLLRYTAADLGFRPVPPHTCFWESPDIEVESPLPGFIVAGQENFVHARVFNLGKADALPTRVDFFWGDPSLGLGPANMNWIGTEWVEVRARSTLDVRCSTPWVPTYLNGGHECLMVNCSSPILDPVAQPFQPTVDRHVGQRNVAVLEAMAGQTLDFTLALNNLLPMAATATVTVRMEHVAIAANLHERLGPVGVLDLAVAYGQGKANTAEELLSRFQEGTKERSEVEAYASFLRSTQAARDRLLSGVRSVGGQFRSSPCVSSGLEGESCLVGPAQARGLLGNLLIASDKLQSPAQPARAGELVLREVPLRASERRRLVVQMGAPGNARPGEYVVYHLAQQTEGLPMGGYTVALRIVPGVPG